MHRTLRTLVALTLALLVSVGPALAGTTVRGSSRTCVTRSGGVNRSVAVNRRTTVHGHGGGNVYIHRDVDVDVHHGHAYHPVAAAVVATAVIGAILYTPPPTYTVVVVNGVTFYQSGTTWYQPRFAGTAVTYVVVAAPR